jgi:hypothetical protein
MKTSKQTISTTIDAKAIFCICQLKWMRYVKNLFANVLLLKRAIYLTADKSNRRTRTDSSLGLNGLVI